MFCCPVRARTITVIMDTPEKIWHLIARSLNEQASADEQQELLKALEQDELLRQQYDLLTRIWIEKESNFECEDGDATRNTISRIINKAKLEEQAIEILPVKNRFNRKRVWLAAASFLLLALAGWFWISKSFFSGDDKKLEAIETRNGSRTRSLLIDGTVVSLNVGSKLYYDGDFSGPTREVRLEGEAFFDVAKNPDRPFIVHTGGVDIKVLGTSFNVKSYPDDNTIETTLYHGSVQVFREDDPQKIPIQLKPNEKLIIPKQSANDEPAKLPVEGKVFAKNNPPASFTIARIDSTKKENERLETAWLYSRLEFRGETFEEVAKKMERWYNVTIVFTDEIAKYLSFTGAFENESVEQAFRYLKEANSFNYKINNHEISVGSSQ